MTSLPFLPRSLQKRKAASSGSTSKEPSNVIQPLPQLSHNETSTDQEPQLGINDDDMLTLLELALSDYNVFNNLDLQKAIKEENEGYLSFKLLSRRFRPLADLDPEPLETDMVRCISSASDSMLETRMKLYGASQIGRSSRAGSSGSFEVRRKDWQDLTQVIEKKDWNDEFWDKRTVYLERIPAGHRTIPSIVKYISEQLSQSKKKAKTIPRNAIQSISFPPHLAQPNETPRFKGFAFVILDNPSRAKGMCQTFPWENPPADSSSDIRDFGTRALQKDSWEKLKDEYLAYQKYMISKSSSKSQIAGPWKQPSAKAPVPEAPPEPPKEPAKVAKRAMEYIEEPEYADWFPRNCLVFIRNIHPETNKTALRALFGSRLSSGKEAVDYVDFNKGIDSCHLRLVSPSDAATLVSSFSESSIAQKDSLDQEGHDPSSSRPAITIELVQGKREELYWEKVPEKIRQAGLHRLCTGLGGEENVATPEVNSGKIRKRRKKG
ncbi:hypothetical protein M422DRAFT_40734 [Sphaerobolus stellatus SS14]|nr:hypothetical protein M422DRAFT_40734 [Sphaerobolus stellatus SS14]